MKLNEKRGSSMLNDKEQRIKTLDDKINDMKRKIMQTDRETRTLNQQMEVVEKQYEEACQIDDSSSYYEQAVPEYTTHRVEEKSSQVTTLEQASK